MDNYIQVLLGALLRSKWTLLKPLLTSVAHRVLKLPLMNLYKETLN